MKRQVRSTLGRGPFFDALKLAAEVPLPNGPSCQVSQLPSNLSTSDCAPWTFQAWLQGLQQSKVSLIFQKVTVYIFLDFLSLGLLKTYLGRVGHGATEGA